MSDRVSSDFRTAWQIASQIPGWLTEAQAALLWETSCGLAGQPLFVEIGSHQGRSTVVLGLATVGKDGRVIAVDPFVDGRLFGGSTTRDKFQRNIAVAGLEDVVELVEEYSTRARPTWSRAFDGLYIDGKHDYWTLSDDLRWSRHLGSGAPLLIHDCFSSIGVTLGVLVHVLFSRHLRYERRVGSLALFRVTSPTLADRARIVAELPWWIRNVMVKVLLRLRLRPVARWVFGHRGRYDPF